MYQYLTSATDENGKRSTRAVDAESSAQAISQLEAEGCTDIELHTDDAAAVMGDLSAIDGEHVTAEDMVEYRSLSPLGMYLHMVKRGFLTIKSLLALSVIFVAWSLYNRAEFGIFFWLAFGVISLPFLIPIYYAFFSSSNQFNQLMHSSAWGQWESVLKLTQQLRGKVPETELDFREAIALAKLGHFEKGLAKITRHESNDEIPRWMYLSRLGEFYGNLEMHEESIEYIRQSYEDAPENPTVEFDYALVLLKNERQLDEARRLMASVEEKPLSDLLRFLLPVGHGLIALNNGDYSAAMDQFQALEENLKPLAAQPLFQMILDFNSAYLVMAAARSGDTTLAKRHYVRAKKRLTALGSKRLLSKLEETMKSVL